MPFLTPAACSCPAWPAATKVQPFFLTVRQANKTHILLQDLLVKKAVGAAPPRLQQHSSGPLQGSSRSVLQTHSGCSRQKALLNAPAALHWATVTGLGKSDSSKAAKPYPLAKGMCSPHCIQPSPRRVKMKWAFVKWHAAEGLRNSLLKVLKPIRTSLCWLLALYQLHEQPALESHIKAR